MGNKAANLHLLARIGMRVPRTYAISWEAYHRYLRDDPSLIPELQKELTNIIDPAKTYAVRSSANIEDSMDRSFAGQFKSVLHVQGVDHILLAAWSVWASAQSPVVRAYLDRHQLAPDNLSMGVVIQEMVTPVFSGVSLSRNPVTGGDEIVVEAVTGEGTQLVQSGCTPDRWVNKWGGWTARPERSSIPESLIRNVVDGARLLVLQPVDQHRSREFLQFDN